MKVILTLVVFLTVISTFAQQTQTQHTGWLFLTHTQKLTEKFDFLADVQTRTADDYRYWNTLLLRGAISYNINDRNNVGIGYAFFGEWEKENGTKTFNREHRVFEQYQYEKELGHKTLNLRARLEQRFIKEEEILFSQRARIFASLQAPILANEDFTMGIYLRLQNELFLNVFNKENVNGKVFDQNRPYAGVGYRTGKKLDFELGYMYLLQTEMDEKFIRNVFQVMITTNF